MLKSSGPGRSGGDGDIMRLNSTEPCRIIQRLMDATFEAQELMRHDDVNLTMIRISYGTLTPPAAFPGPQRPSTAAWGGPETAFQCRQERYFRVFPSMNGILPTS